MRRPVWVLGFVFSVALVFSFSGETTNSGGQFSLKNFKNERLPSAVLRKEPDFGHVPLYFIPNRGQVHHEALFYARTSAYTLWLTKEGLAFDTARLVFLNADKNPKLLPLEPSEHRVNYLIGDSPSQWRTDIPTSAAVMYGNVYKNIDLKIYGIEKQVEYDWIVKPGGKPEDIRFAYQDVKGTRIDTEGDLVVESPRGELKHRKPRSYQVIGDSRIDVEVGFEFIEKDRFGFDVKAYNPDYDLIIDPLVLGYSSYLGGSGWDGANAVALDRSGAVYVTGGTLSADFPVKNAYKKKRGGYMDVFVTKFSPSGNSLVYSTYWGGPYNDEAGTGIAVDGSGAVYVTGASAIAGETIRNFARRPYEKSAYPSHAFVFKLSPAGNSLVYSTTLSGEYDVEASGIALDSNKAAYVTGYTNSSDFPVKNAPQKAYGGGGSDAFVTMIAPSGKSLVYSTFLGGNNSDFGSGIVVDGGGAAYIVGYTFSADFSTLNAYQKAYRGGGDAFVTKIAPNGTSLVYSTYLGGSKRDEGKSIALYGKGAAYMIGDTSSSNFPLMNAYQKILRGPQDTFVTKLSPDGKRLVYSTYLGGSAADFSLGIAVDGNGAATTTGFTGSANFPLKNPVQPAYGGKDDAFVTKLSPDGRNLVYSTYLGGADADLATGIAMNGQGAVFITGYTYSADFPTMNAFQKTFGGGGSDAFLAKLSFVLPSAVGRRLPRKALYPR
ncbi:MAG: SBBP repeat-containing protein [Candidatus Aminicenantes bacterium]|nr:SBBP repeat-containing protein [Candidatus Aminicenantes bacterium]